MTYEELAQENQALRRKNEDLEYRLEELLSVGQSIPFEGMTRTQFRIVQLLARRSPMTLPYDALNAAIKNSDELVCVRNNVNVHLARARKFMKPFGIEVLNVRGIGHRMPPESKAKWDTLVNQANGVEVAA